MSADPSPAGNHRRPKSRNEFHIAIICALPLESTAVAATFDQLWDSPSYGKLYNDTNTYTTARVGDHNVVLAYLPVMGGNAAAGAIRSFLLSYPKIELALLVGVCGGAPFDAQKDEIILGDVVVSDSIVRPDFARRYPDKLRRKDQAYDDLNPRLLPFFHKIRSVPIQITLQQRMRTVLDGLAYERPNHKTDVLYLPSYRHKHQTPGLCETCDSCLKDSDEVCKDALAASCDELRCEEDHSICRGRITKAIEEGSTLSPVIHLGKFSCANQVMKSAKHRDDIFTEENAIAFEMEGAGLWDSVPTLIIKGVCDYSDSHKNKFWQEYASAAAASCMKALLEQWTPTDETPAELVPYSELSQASSTPAEYFQIPHRRIRYFVGREDVFLQLDTILLSPRPGPRVATICGMGGQGKTQLALEYCRRKKHNPFNCILWLEANSEMSLQGSLETASLLLGMPSAENCSRSSRVSFVLQKLSSSSQPWLIVFDNYDDIEEFDNIMEYFPEGNSGAILVTSRHAGTYRLVENQTTDILELPGLDSANAISLLIQQSGLPNDDLNCEASNAVVERLGQHPLAIVQAAAYIKLQRISIDSFLIHYERQMKKILQTVPKLSEYNRKLNDNEKKVALSAFTTWELSYQQLESQEAAEPIAADLLTLLCLFDHKEIPEELFRYFSKHKNRDAFRNLNWRGLDAMNCFVSQDDWDHERFMEVATSISDLSLIQLSKNGNNNSFALRLHPLVKDWVKLRTDSSLLAEMTFVMSMILGQVALDSTRDTETSTIIGVANLPTDVQQNFLSHILAHEANFMQLDENSSPSLTSHNWPFDQRQSNIFLTLQMWTGILVMQMGAHALAQNILRRTWANIMIFFKKNCSLLWSCAQVLLLLHADHREYEIATQFGESVLRIFEPEEGGGSCVRKEEVVEDDSALIHELGFKTALAEALILLTRFKEGKVLLDEVITKGGPVLGCRHTVVLRAQCSLGFYYLTQGSPKMAEDLLSQTLKVSKEVNGGAHPVTLESLRSLSGLMTQQARWKDAEQIMAETLEINRLALGDEHPATQTAELCLACNYYHQHRYDEAEKRLLHIYDADKILIDKPDYLAFDYSYVLEKVYRGQNRREEADALLGKIRNLWSEKLDTLKDAQNSIKTCYNF